ncbi:hypothetical protein ACQR1Y_11905 [Bradyrhizobium sp. HKCCYLRH3099]|uniref:hypothetical protein n=1 Tax=unclassified Bradyrhizobium TaxID=2631580 RepID=UPI003EB9B5B3
MTAPLIGLTDTITIAVSITGIELVALKKLSLVSHALADKIGGRAGLEQKTLAATLDDLLRQIEIKASCGS